MTNTTACREAFEKWGREIYLALGRKPGDGVYRSSLVENMWDAWQAAWNIRASESEAVADDHEVTVEVIGYAKEGEDGPYIEWLPEGGIHDLPAGLPIFAIEGSLDIEEGWMSLYTHPRATSDGEK